MSNYGPRRALCTLRKKRNPCAPRYTLRKPLIVGRGKLFSAITQGKPNYAFLVKSLGTLK